MIINIE